VLGVGIWAEGMGQLGCVRVGSYDSSDGRGSAVRPVPHPSGRWTLATVLQRAVP